MLLHYDDYAPSVIAHYRLKKTGKEPHGACPNCGGKDRFWIFRKDDSGLGVNCRQCGDFKAIFDRMRDDGVLPEWQSEPINCKHEEWPATNTYLDKKGFREPLVGNAFLDGKTLCVPMFDLETGSDLGVQRIEPNGDKRFAKGSETSNAVHEIGIPTDTAFAVEGWATGYALHLATGRQVFVCFSADGLAKKAARIKHPNIVVAADNDEAGINAARASGRPWVAPEAAGADWWDTWHQGGSEAVIAQLDGFNFGGKRAETILQAPKLFDHVLDISLEPPSWLIDGILPEASVAAIVAPSYSGKSFIAIDMACSIASGTPYHGRQVASGEVFCVIGESRTGWRRRVASWCKGRDVDVSRQRLGLHCSKYGLNFRDPATIDGIKAELRACESVKLIVIDTLARTFGGGNENAAQDMGQFIDACDALKFEFGAAVLIVHHMGKDSGAGARGSSAFYGALDTSMLVKRVGTDIQLICDKQKEAPEFETLQFCFVKLREEEEPPVLQLVATSTRTFGPNLGKNEQLALETFVEATNGMSPDRQIHRDNWREFFDRRHTGDTAKQKNDAFSRARRELVSKGLLCNLNDVYTLGDKATSDDIAGIVAGQTP